MSHLYLCDIHSTSLPCFSDPAPNTTLIYFLKRVPWMFFNL